MTRKFKASKTDYISVLLYPFL